jgi:hypothetical protein
MCCSIYNIFVLLLCVANSPDALIFKCGTKRGRNPLKTLGGAGKNAAECHTPVETRSPTPGRFPAQRGRLHPMPELGALRGKRSSRRMSRSTSPTKKKLETADSLRRFTQNPAAAAQAPLESSAQPAGLVSRREAADRILSGPNPETAGAIIRPKARERRQCDLRHCAGSGLRLKV